MSNVVFILGAGASRQCGAPLMADFLDVASDLLRANAVQEKRAEFEKVFAAIGALQAVHSSAAKHLSEAEHIFVIGYSLPETDSFFRHLYALGSVGTTPLRRIAIFNPDAAGATDRRFKALLGPGAIARYEYHEKTFEQATDHIKELFPKRP